MTQHHPSACVNSDSVPVTHRVDSQGVMALSLLNLGTMLGQDHSSIATRMAGDSVVRACNSSAAVMIEGLGVVQMRVRSRSGLDSIISRERSTQGWRIPLNGDAQ